MSKQLKKSLIYSMISGIILTFAFSFVPYFPTCCKGCTCDFIISKYYGFPFHFMTASYKITQFKFLVLNYLIYFIISFITIFCIIMVINYFQNKKKLNK